MTVYEYFEECAKVNRNCAKKAETQKMNELFVKDAERWERRAKALTPEVAAKDLDEVEVWRILETIDKANQEVFS